jgi:hypothetical protein
MSDPGAILPSALLLLVLAVMLSFAFGTQRNIRKGNLVLEWLQSALPRIGPRTTLRWLGSSAVQLDIVDPSAPFRQVAVVVVLEPRDVPLLWFWSRRSGRRDVLIFRTSLKRAPRSDLEAFDPSGWLRSSDLEEAGTWPAVEFPAGIRATTNAEPGDGTVAAARRAWDQLAAATDGVWRLSIRRTVPHLEVHVRPPSELPSVHAERVVEPLRELAIALDSGR